MNWTRAVSAALVDQRGAEIKEEGNENFAEKGGAQCEHMVLYFTS